MNLLTLEVEAQLSRMELNLSRLERSIDQVDSSQQEMLKGLQQCEVALSV